MNLFGYYYVVTSKSIQEFIFKGNKLKAAIGASQLIDDLPSVLVKRLLDEAGAAEGKDFRFLSMTAGGARLLLKDKELADYLCGAMPLAVSLYAPGLKFVQAAVSLDGLTLEDAMYRADSKILPVRRMMVMPSLPVAGPLVRRTARTGRPAVAKGEKGDFVCAAMKRKTESAERGKGRLADALGLDSDKLTDDISKISGNSSRIAVVHIDGNGLGAIVRAFFDRAKDKGLSQAEMADKYAAFCDVIREASNESLKEALEPIVSAAAYDRYYPFRPIICAGDDVTVILRNYDAVGFADRFIKAFENKTYKKFSGDFSGFIDDDKAMLTACAGIVFINGKFPFYQAYELCEALCKYAKDKTDRKCSAVAFWRMTTSRVDDFDEIIARELTKQSDKGDTILTMMPYVTGSKGENKPGGYRRLEDLVELKDAIEDMPRGSARQLVNEVYAGESYTRKAYERMLQIGKDKKPSETKRLENALCTLTGGGLFFEEGGTKYTPLYDAVQLVSEDHAGKGR